MAIKIKRNEAGNCITFEGSSNPVYWNSCLSGEVDSVDNTLINVVNDVITAQSGVKQYEFFRIPFNNFIDAEGSSFIDAQSCSDYITQEANVLGSIGEQIATSTDVFNFYLDSKDNTVIMSTGDYFPVNTIQASLYSDNTMRINSAIGVKTYYSNINLSNVSINSVITTGTDNEKIDYINSLFQSTGTSTGSAPLVTSSLSINIVEGDTLNYELTADFGVGYEWDLSSVSGVVNVEGNARKIIGGSSLTSGVYNIPIKVINYNGEDSKTIVLTVDVPDFSNSKSVQFQQNDYLNASATEVNNVFGRSSNGSGQAWSISTYFKAGTHNNSVQTIMFAGGNNATSNPSVLLYWEGNHAGRQNISIRHGSAYNYIEKSTPIGSVSNNGQWNHILVTFDGGTTGNSSTPLSQYYSRFKIFLNGVEQSTINSHQAFGNASAFNIQVFRVGRWGTGTSYLRDSCKLDELSFWNSDQSSNISEIYNNGSPFDLNSLTNVPNHWWRMGDEDTFPTLSDSIGNTDLTMNNMTVADIVTDTP